MEGKRTLTTCDGIDVLKQIEEFARLQMEYKEKTLAEIITKYDFLVGSKECKDRLMGILPDSANIICSPYIEDPTMIYVIKKFDIKDLLTEPCRVTSKEEIRCGNYDCVHYGTEYMEDGEGSERE